MTDEERKRRLEKFRADVEESKKRSKAKWDALTPEEKERIHKAVEYTSAPPPGGTEEDK